MLTITVGRTNTVMMTPATGVDSMSILLCTETTSIVSTSGIN